MVSQQNRHVALDLPLEKKNHSLFFISKKNMKILVTKTIQMYIYNFPLLSEICEKKNIYIT